MSVVTLPRVTRRRLEREHIAEAVEAAGGGQTAPDDEYEILDLPAGDHRCINIDWSGDKDPTKVLKLDSKSWLLNGKRGIIIRGKGIGVTHLWPSGWDKVALAIGQHSGEVIVQGMTIHGGAKAVHVGSGGHKITPGFLFAMDDVFIDCTNPNSSFGGHRPKWGTFVYQADVLFRNSGWDCRETSEHAHYQHGSAGRGMMWLSCHIDAVGGQGIKDRTARWIETGNGIEEECGWAGPDQMVVIKNTQIREFYQAWADRGGAGIVMEGTGKHIWIELVEVNPAKEGSGNQSAAQRAYCIAISSEGEYTMEGAHGGSVGAGNGIVTIKSSAMCSYGKGNSDFTNKILRVGKNGGNHAACESLLIEGCGIYGENMQVELEGKTEPHLQFPITVRGNNSPRIRSYCSDVLGMPTSHEALTFKGAGGKKALSVDWSA